MSWARACLLHKAAAVPVLLLHCRCRCRNTQLFDPPRRYEEWAIRVDNVRGVKVGHLPRVLVCHVSLVLLSPCCLLRGTAACGWPALVAAKRLHPPLPAPAAPARLCPQLSPLVDQGLLHLEGIVPRGGWGPCWGLPAPTALQRRSPCLSFHRYPPRL